MAKPDTDNAVNQQTQKLEEALQRARAADAELFDVRAKVSDLRYLRLEELRERLEAMTAGDPLAKTILTLRTLPGDPPRLIIDESAHVVMQPDPRSYTVIHDGPETRQTLIESQDADEAETKIADYIAHRLLELKRAEPEEAEKPVSKPDRAGPLLLLIFWLFGAAMGGVAAYVYLVPSLIALR